MESFSIEIICKNSKNIVIDTQYSHPSSKIFEKYLKKCFNKTKARNNHKVYANLKANMQTIFFNYVLIILKPTRISKTSATVIDHLHTSNFLETDKKQEY